MMIRSDTFRRQALGDGLKAEQFLSFRPVFDAVVAMARAGTPIDAATLSTFLDRQGKLGEVQSAGVSGHAAVSDIANHEPTAENWQYWLRDLREAHAQRIARDAAAWLAEASDSAEAMEAAKAASEAIKAAISSPSRSKTPKEAAREFVRWMEEARAAGPIPGIRTSIDELDQLTGGMRPGQLWVVLAQTSRGKSVLMQQFGVEALTAGRRTAIFSIEMQAYEVMARIVSRRGKFDFGKLMKPYTLLKRDEAIVATHVQELTECPFTIDDTPAMTLAHIEAESHRIRDQHGDLGLVVVDYLQIVHAVRRKGGNREEDVATISGGLKQLAKALNCPVVTGAQLNRSNQVRESDKISFDADVVLMVGDDGIKVAKNRNGKKGDILPYELVGEFQSFVPFIPEQREEERRVADWKADQESAHRSYRR